MTKLERHELESVERARKLLLAKFFDASANEKLRKKEVVRQLLGTIIAVHESGMSFPEIAATFEEAGLALNANTLRLYYYELKSQAEIAAHERAHAEQITKVRSQLDSADREKLSMEALRTATVQAKERRAGAGFPPEQMDRVEVKPERPKRPPRARPPAGAAPPPPTHALAAAFSREEEGGFPEPPPDFGSALANETTGTTSASGDADTNTDSAVGTGTAPTIDEAERAGAAFRGVRPDLRENVVVHQGRVYYETGEAFDGVLTKAQAHLLRRVGKLVAPTQMSSSKDFVAMPNKL